MPSKEDMIEEYEERAAVYEFDALIPRPYAEFKASLDMKHVYGDAFRWKDMPKAT